MDANEKSRERENLITICWGQSQNHKITFVLIVSSSSAPSIWSLLRISRMNAYYGGRSLPRVNSNSRGPFRPTMTTLNGSRKRSARLIGTVLGIASLSLIGSGKTAVGNRAVPEVVQQALDSGRYLDHHRAVFQVYIAHGIDDI